MGIINPTVAHADATSNGVTLSINYGDQEYDGDIVVEPGIEYTATIQYRVEDAAGQTVTITAPQGVTLPTQVPPGNDAIESITRGDDNSYTITFKNDPPGNDQGGLVFTFTFDAPVEESGFEEVTWRLDDETTSEEVIVKKPGDEFFGGLDNSFDKSVGEHTLNDKVNYNQDTGQVTVDPTITDVPVPYTLTFTSNEDRTVTVTDTISDHLAFDQDSFTAEITSWDENGLNKTTTNLGAIVPSFDGQTFTIADLELEQDSILTISYDAYLKDTSVAAIQQSLQQQADEINPATGGDLRVELTNEAAIGDESIQAPTGVGTHRPGDPQPNTGEGFGKRSDLSGEQVKELGTDLEDDEVTLKDPVDVSYVLKADLTVFADYATEYNGRYALTDNVVIRDIPDQTGIKLGTDRVTATVNGDPFPRFRETPRTVSVEDFFGDDYIGRYMWIEQDGKDVLLVNVGKDTSQVWEITVPAQIVDIDGYAESTNPQEYAKYRMTNVAYFYYRGINNDQPWNSTHERKATNHHFVVPQPDGSHITDPTQFEKTLDQPLPQMEVGQQYPVPYTFHLKSGAIQNLRNSRIVDVVNTDVFDLSNLDTIEISGTYNGQQLTANDFTLALETDADGNDLLVLTPSDGFAGLPSDQVLDGELKITVTLLTHVIDGKKTITLDNSAYVEGGIRNEWTWTGEATGTATSYGTELEVRKSVYRQSEGDWTQNLRVALDEDGNPVQTEFIYRVQLFPHGDFSNFGILDIVDVLPEGTELLGLVEDQNLQSGVIKQGEVHDLGGKLTATLDLDANTVTIVQKPGTKLGKNQPYLNFKVALVPDTEAPQGEQYEYLQAAPIVNKIGATQAVITVTNGYPLLIQKLDSLRPDLTITDRDARFTVTGPNDFELSDVFVVDGQLKTLDADGKEVGIVVPELPGGGVPVGEYLITEVTAPEGFEDPADGTVWRAFIGADGSSAAVTIYNDPSPLFAIGNFTWIDANNNGIQDDDEVLPDVAVDLIDAATGNVVASTTTDANGFYLFDLLPEGEYKVRFTLTEDQAKVYQFTDNLRGDEVTEDSDAVALQGTPWIGETGVITLDLDNQQLVEAADYEHGDVRAFHGIDPTWDAGVVLKSYAIGDYTWIDANRNGVQDAGEDVLPGVTVTLTDANGQPVFHIDGSEVQPTTTDVNGHYQFDLLPPGDYRVHFELTADQSERYLFTAADSPEATEANGDSDAVVSDNPAKGSTGVISLGDDNPELVAAADYENGTIEANQGVDPTWDAGVVTRTYAIGDRVWIDEDRDGVQGPDEPSLPGVKVELLDEDGNPVLDGDDEPIVTWTDEDGNYVFDELPAGKYRVKFTLTPDQQKVYRFTEQDTTNTDEPNDDSDADPTDGLTTVIELGPDNQELTKDYDSAVKATEGIDPTWDAGVIRRTYAIGDFTWIDANNNGIQDDDEVLPGVKVELLDGDGNVITETVTDDQGRYLFDELPAGDYQIRFTLTEEQSAKYTFTRSNEGSEDGIDSDAIHEPVSGTELQVGTTEVFRLDSDSAALVPGSDYEHGTVTATEGIDPTWDAGVIEKTYAVGDYVWVDTNRDGIQDGNEPVLPGVTVDLIDPVTGGVIATTTTDDQGRYLFDELPAGEYQVRFTLTDEQAARYVFTGSGASEQGTDSDAVVVDTPAQGWTRTIVLDGTNTWLTRDYDRTVTATEGIDPTWDAGVVLASVCVGDLVWVDTNKNGRQDEGEPGIPGVVLTIVGPDGKPVTDVFGNPVNPVTTDESGNYRFCDLPVLKPGEKYTVFIDRDASRDALKGYLPTKPGQGDRAGDSSNWQASSEGLTQDGDADLTLDFGFVLPDPTPEPPAPEDDELADTGAPVGAGIIGAGVLLLVAGAGVLLASRRRA